MDIKEHDYGSYIEIELPNSSIGVVIGKLNLIFFCFFIFVKNKHCGIKWTDKDQIY